VRAVARKECFQLPPARQPIEKVPRGKRRDHPRHAHQHRGLSELQKLVRVDLQTDAKQEEQNAESGHRVREFVRINPSKYAWPDQDASENLANDSRLTKPLAEFSQNLRAAKDNQHADGQGKDAAWVATQEECQIRKVHRP